MSSQPFTTSELALLVYQAAQDRERWPELVHALKETANPFDEEAVYGDREARSRIMEELLPHIRQALEIEQAMRQGDAARDLLSQTLEMLPVGIALVDDSLNILTMNRQADISLRESRILGSHGGRVRINNRDQHRALHQAIQQSLQAGSSHTLMLSDQRPGGAISLMVCPADVVRATDQQEPSAVTLFISNPEINNLVNEQTVADLYGLSEAEASLTRHLIDGWSLSKMAAHRGVSEHTVRSQFKSIFRKTDTNRQADLVSLILSGLAPIGNSLPTVADRSGSGPAQDESGTRYFVTADGRTLSYCQYGDPDGRPIVFFHSVRGSRLEVPGSLDVLYRLKLRLIVPDRPGYGRSDALEDRTTDDLARDVAALADHLELDRFLLLGYSLGGFLALHCAAHLGERVERLGLVSALAPPQTDPGGRPLKGLFRLAVTLADKAPSLAERILNQMARSILRNPAKHLGSDADRQLLANPQTRHQYARAMAESCSRGSGGFVEDLKAVARTPELSPDQLALPVYLWHGQLDGQVSVRQAICLDEWLTNSELTLLPDGGHFFIYDRWEAILESFTG
ncbi:alpha/beta hydrolase [Marinobacter sp. M-5]|uniref:alpha/beta hydrolase n=1 Tax=Marinobacter sp. M-5 TaxID=3081089 RepID=UPI00293C151C|nr:alpha/beta hydrolase [Marinobacter sp. M-5]MDV3504658.1 alpha/beta hydrolase [Marinobacter sp. M-5]